MCLIDQQLDGEINIHEFSVCMANATCISHLDILSSKNVKYIIFFSVFYLILNQTFLFVEPMF